MASREYTHITMGLMHLLGIYALVNREIFEYEATEEAADSCAAAQGKKWRGRFDGQIQLCDILEK
jgi:hypothetical protein